MTVNIGELKHRITIDLESNVSDGQGGFVTTWQLLGTCWASADNKSIRDRFYRGQTEHTEGITFTIRQPQTFSVDTRLSDKYRITHRGQYFKVLGISQHKYNLDFYMLTCDLWGATTT